MSCATDDTWATKVIKLLLTEHGGRARFDKLRVSILQKGLMIGVSLKNNFKSCNRLFLFEKDGEIKHVSVGWKDVKICCKLLKAGSKACINEKCSEFHVCKSFISGHCAKDSSCPFGHELQNETNKKVSDTLGLSSFSSEEIRTIISRSHPAVCVNYNTGGCDDDDCPDLHVCSRFIQKKCIAESGCKFDHSLQTSEHNKWVLDTFNVCCLTDVEIMKRILVKNDFQGVPNAHAEPQSLTTSSRTSLSLLSGSLSTPEEQTEEYVFRVFRFLLERFRGRTKFSTFVFKRGNLFQSCQRDEIINWLKENTDRFVLYESDGDLNFISVYSSGARLCLMYNEPGTFICDDKSCKNFHICRDFVTGACVNNAKCGLSHSFSTGLNRQVCLDLNLPQLTDNELCMVILCSSPTVCVNHNTEVCRLDYCPDLHVCTKNILNICTSGDDCKFGHVIKNSEEHNSYVLKAFRMDTWQEDVLRRLVIVKKGEKQKISRELGISPVQAAPAVGQPESETVSHVEETSTGCHQQRLSVPSVESVLAEGDPRWRQQYNQKISRKLGISPVQAPPAVGQPESETVSHVEETSTGCHPQSLSVPSVGNMLADGDPRLRQQNIVAEEEEEADLDFSKYEYICETYTWTGECPRAPNCPRYHSPHRLPYLWLIIDDGQWCETTTTDSIELERLFCSLKHNRDVPVDFFTMEYKYERKPAKLRRLSTPSYVTATPGTPLNFYTQWVWYRRERDGTYTPFIPGSLQYTLEEKYLKGQHMYYFEFEDLRLMVDTRSSYMTQTNLDTQGVARVVRRPVFVSPEEQDAPTMSPLLLDKAPPPVLHRVPRHWSAVDRYQEFELFELTSGDPEHADVQRQFFSTMDINDHQIVHVFRVQNPRLWYKYSSARRAMTPMDQVPEEVEERQLFHGTPTLEAVRGICANSFDFRRSGENAGTAWGRGAYFSTTACFSHLYTRAHIPAKGAYFTRYSQDCTKAKGDPMRFMFLGRILVGQYTLGDPSYTKPPVRDRLKLYDSCVNNLLDPTIFVIFDLAQSYPEYLIQYTDVFDSEPPPSSSVVTSQNHASPPSVGSASDASSAVATLRRALPAPQSLGLISGIITLASIPVPQIPKLLDFNLTPPSSPLSPTPEITSDESYNTKHSSDTESESSSVTQKTKMERKKSCVIC